MIFTEALAYLLSLGHETLTIKLGLANTETLLGALGDPQKKFPAVQIAGTNGKGSTAVMLDSICRAAGIRTGLFTSPHLVSITERIRINGERIPENDFARLTNEVRAVAEELVAHRKLETLPTFFEHVTAIALLAFRRANVELAILETGLGGRLDSTSAAPAAIIAMTAIAMDHEEYLGQTIADIAREKAAVIRRGATAVIAPQDENAFKVILGQCEATEVDPILVQSEMREPSSLAARIHHPTRAARAGTPVRSRFCSATEDGRCRVTFETPQTIYADVLLGLRGRHQIDNGAVAIALAEALRERGFAIAQDAIIRGLETAQHAGRLELWEGQPQILFDGAHNPAAALALRAYLDEFVPQPITMIFGAMKDKRLDEMADALWPKAHQLILTELDNPRAASLEMLMAVVPREFDDKKIATASTIRDAIEIAKRLTPADGLICVTGSLYLIGAVQKFLRPERLQSVAHQSA